MSQSRTHQRWFRVGAVLSLTLLGCTPPSEVARRPRPTSNLIDISRGGVIDPNALINALKARGKRYGLQTMCEGGGMANVTIVERL